MDVIKEKINYLKVWLGISVVTLIGGVVVTVLGVIIFFSYEAYLSTKDNIKV